MHVKHNALTNLRGDNLLVQFDRPGEMLDMIRDLPQSQRIKRQMQRRDYRKFFGGDWSDLERGAIEGDKAMATRAASLMKQINRDVAPVTKMRKRVSSPTGRVVTGAYLSSDPMPARKRVTVSSNRAPVTIAINLSSSEMTGEKELVARGVAVAALVRLLVAHRPVALHLVGSLWPRGGLSSVVTCQFPTAPCDSFRLAHLTASQTFGRAAMFAAAAASDTWGRAIGKDLPRGSVTSIQWPGNSQAYANDERGGLYRDLKEHVAGNGDFLYIPAAGCYGAAYRQMLDTPVTWINERLAEFTRQG